MDLLKHIFTSKQNTEPSRRALSALLPKKKIKNPKKTRSLDISAEKETIEAGSTQNPAKLTDKFKDCSWGLTYQQSKKTLLLDLDNTLIYASKEIPDILDYTTVFFEKGGEYIVRYVIKRPGVLKFLKKLSKRFNLCVYTAAEEIYARKVIEATNISKYIYTLYDRSHCEKINKTGYLKNIWSLGFEQTQAVLIDDLVAQAKYQPENCIHMKPFEGEVSDRELYALYPFLQKLSTVEDVRSVQKNLAEYKASVSRALSQQVKTPFDFGEYGADVEEGCCKTNIRTFECPTTMMKRGNQLLRENVC
jgi:RNA polymerase II subunit A small phosphatase-like protein